MTSHVTDTNVGEMTEHEALERLQLRLKISKHELFEIPPEYRRAHGEQLTLDIKMYDMAIEALQFQQELVRCKDCANALPWRGDSFYCSVYSYETWRMLVIDDGFCHLGERRDEE